MANLAYVIVLSGPRDERSKVMDRLTTAGFAPLITDHDHGLPSYTDPITAHDRGKPNSGHTPGTEHPAEVGFLVQAGEHKGCMMVPTGALKKDGTFAMKAAPCPHVGVTEMRPHDCKHVGKPYEPDLGISFATLVGGDPNRAAKLALEHDWTLRLHAHEMGPAATQLGAGIHFGAPDFKAIAEGYEAKFAEQQRQIDELRELLTAGANR